MSASERSWSAVFILAWLAGARAALATTTVELVPPRDFGYFIGDVFTHDVRIALDPGVTLDRASLPKPGPRTYWLDLVAVDLDDDGMSESPRHQRLRLRYQTFYAPLEPKALTTPGFSLGLLEGAGRSEIQVPPWTFLMSPMREVVGRGAGTIMTLRSDVAPTPVSLAAERGLAAASAVVAVASLAALAWLRDWISFRGKERPFAAALRRIARHLSEPPGSKGYVRALLALHRAFDAAAGHRLLADDLESFLEDRRGFRSLGGEIGAFFAASRHAFFGAGAEQAKALFSERDLEGLARRLARLERAGA